MRFAAANQDHYWRFGGDRGLILACRQPGNTPLPTPARTYHLYVHNNPINHIDPLGLWVEDVAIGIPSLAIGAHSLWQNIKAGKVGAALVDAVGIAADVGAIATPAVPGGVGLGIKAARAAKALETADKVINTVQAVGGAVESAQQGDALGVVTGTVLAGLNAKNSVPTGKLSAVADEGADAVKTAQKQSQALGETTGDLVTDTAKKPPHANKIDDRPATLYEKYDEDGNFLKHGVTKHEDPAKRYTKKEIDGGEVRPIERGPRSTMLKKERERVETNPGPDNHEPWAGKRATETDE